MAGDRAVRPNLVVRGPLVFSVSSESFVVMVEITLMFLPFRRV